VAYSKKKLQGMTMAQQQPKQVSLQLPSVTITACGCNPGWCYNV